jgi:hypothetical protein
MTNRSNGEMSRPGARVSALAMAAIGRSPTRRTEAGILGLVVLLGALVGCGGGRQTALAVVTQAPSKTHAAKTVRVSFNTTVQGQSIQGSGLFDLSNRQGTLTTTLPGLGSVDAILDNTTIYEKLPPQLSAPVGKAWFKLDVATGLQKLTGVNSQFMSQSFSSDPTTTLDYLRGASNDIRKVGSETLRGVSTTHYHGTIDLNLAAAKATDPNRKAGLHQIEKLIGITDYPADLWIDNAGRLRQMRYSLDTSKFDIPAAGGVTHTGTATYTIEIYDYGVSFRMPTLPPADQVTDINNLLTQPTAPSAPPSSSTTPLAQAIIPAPDGFALSTGSDVHNGPVDAAGFDQLTASPGLASQLHFVAGYDVTYDSSANNDTVEISLVELSSPVMAAGFTQVAVGGLKSNGLTAVPDDNIPGGTALDATKADSSGSYEHAVVATKDSRVLVVDYTTGTAGSVPLVAALAKQQYERL